MEIIANISSIKEKGNENTALVLWQQDKYLGICDYSGDSCESIYVGMSIVIINSDITHNLNKSVIVAYRTLDRRQGVIVRYIKYKGEGK